MGSAPLGSRFAQEKFCNSCRSDERKKYIERVLSTHPNKWYIPKNEEYEIAAYHPSGDRRYYKHKIHAAQKIENWYSEETDERNHTLSSFSKDD